MEEFLAGRLLAWRMVEGSIADGLVQRGKLLIPLPLAKGMKVKVGDTVMPVATNLDGSVNGKTFVVQGILETATGPGGCDGYLHMDDARDLLRMGDGEVSEIAVRTQQTRNSATSYLLDLRYITERETTWIAEYYRNGIGYTEQQLRGYFSFVHDAYDQYLASNDATQLERTRAFGNSYARANPAQRYFYLQVSQKEPFDILYFTPSITLIRNLDDGSRSLLLELLYTGITDLELRLRLFLVSGDRLSDFGEKQNDRRAELRLR